MVHGSWFIGNLLPHLPDVACNVSTLLPLEVIGITELPEDYHCMFIKFEED
jgi:hypothetical protein